VNAPKSETQGKKAHRSWIRERGDRRRRSNQSQRINRLRKCGSRQIDIPRYLDSNSPSKPSAGTPRTRRHSP
jgi:hypothetical protein